SSTLFYRAPPRRAKHTRPAGSGAKVSPPNPSSSKSIARSTSGASHRIGIWDIDVNAGFLYRVLDAFNRNQKLFKFQRIEATVPMGLTLTGARTRELVKRYGGDADDPNIAENTFAGDIRNVTRPMVKRLGVDVLVCVVAPMIMDVFREDGREGIGWDYFSSS